MIQLRTYQKEAVATVYDHLRNRDDNPCVVMPTGCHGRDAEMLMYDGTLCPVQDVEVGDLLMGPDSQPRKVLHLCRGHGNLYRITPKRGEPFVVNEDHILSLQCTNEGKGDADCYSRGGEIDNLSVAGYLTKSKNWKHLRKLYRVGVDFPGSQQLPVPPYVLGIFLGDGYAADGGVSVTTPDPEIVQALYDYATDCSCSLTVNANGGRCPSYRLVNKKGRGNPVFSALQELSLADCTAATKHIPSPYKVAARAERLAILAGLMDTDGSLKRTSYDYISKSERLARDIVFIARSLGLAAYVRPKQARCQTGAGGTYWRVSVCGDTEQIPCRVAQKQAPPRRQKKSVLRTGFKVEPVGEGDYYGFMLDGDHLYLDGNFTVHHNSGKTPVMARICKDAVARWDGRVLVLAHVKELLEQTAETLQVMAPELDVGIYCAGLKSRDTEHSCLVASIHSVYRRAEELGRFNLVMIDEAHMIPPDGEGMYRTYLQDAALINPNIRLIGLTATPYRMKSGMICEPDHLLNEVCYEIGVKELIVRGYLCPLNTKAGRKKADTDGLHVRAGEFIASETEDLMDTDELVRAACEEIIEHTQNRHSCLIFGSGVDHGKHIAHVLRTEHGVECETVFGETPSEERDAVLERFRAGELPYVVNMNVLTTGFDAPNIDCIAMLRPTLSPGLMYQMCGRGLRTDPSKDDCLILDYGGNIMRHGPIDDIRIEKKDRPGGEAPAKECPECHTLIAAGYRICPDCEHEFPPPEESKHEAKASSADVLSGQTSVDDHQVQEVFYSVHHKRGAPPDHPKTMRVEYELGFNHWQSEFICFEHTGWPRVKAESWWRQRCNSPVPDTAEEAVEMAQNGGLCETYQVTIKSTTGEKYDEITGYKLGPKPAPYCDNDGFVLSDDEIPF